jgi:hypothetical protein
MGYEEKTSEEANIIGYFLKRFSDKCNHGGSHRIFGSEDSFIEAVYSELRSKGYNPEKVLSVLEVCKAEIKDYLDQQRGVLGGSILNLSVLQNRILDTLRRPSALEKSLSNNSLQSA